MASSLRKAQIPIKARGSNKCPHHAGKEVIFACEDCGELACSKCVSTLHRKHAVDDISEIIPRLKVAMQDFVNKAENGYIPELNGELKNLVDKMSRNKNHFKDVICRIVKQNENLKRELDKITNKFITLCREAENENEEILKSHRTELQFKIEELNAQTLELKDTLQSGTNAQVYDTSRGIPSVVTIPVLPSVQDIDFNPTSILIVQLEKLVGECFKTTCDGRTQIYSSVVPDQQCEDISCESEKSEKENYQNPQPQISAKKDRNSNKTPKSNAESFVAFQTLSLKTPIDSIRAASNNQVWVSHKNELKLLNVTETKKTMKMEFVMQDICVSPSTGDIWFCRYIGKSVRKVTGDNTSSVMFHTVSKPLSICISADGNILVGMTRQVVKYTQRGQILCKSKQVKRVPVVRYPYSISPCPVTRNIAIVDLDSGDCGGDDKKHVSILSEDLQLLCRYGPGVVPFNPYDVCYSDTGDIYIADYDNRSIQHISGTGQYIQTVYTDRDKPAMHLCVQSNGDIWAVFGDESVKILQKQ